MTQCPFLHHKPEHYDDANVEIWTCRPFAIGGYCKRGSRCPFLHLYTCPNFEEDGTCPRRTTCKLSHTITESTQTRILNRKEIEEDEDVLVESDEEDEKRSEKKVEKRIVNSYTVNPDSLFDKGIEDKYSYYIDSKPDSPAIPSTNLHTFQDNNEFMIHLDSSDSENDDLEDNNDYVLIDLEPDIIEHNNEAELKNGERNEIKGVKEKQPEEPIEEESKEVEPKEEEPKEEEPKENCEKEELEY